MPTKTVLVVLVAVTDAAVVVVTIVSFGTVVSIDAGNPFDDVVLSVSAMMLDDASVEYGILLVVVYYYHNKYVQNIYQ